MIEFYTLGPLNLMLNIPYLVLTLGKAQNKFALRIQRIPCFDRCHQEKISLDVIDHNMNVQYAINQGCKSLSVCVSMALILCDSDVVVRRHPRAIPLAMITMRKSLHGFPFISDMSMGLRLAALRAARASLSLQYHKHF